MTSITYPPKLTAGQIHGLLKRPDLIAQRIDELLQRQMLAPLLLTTQAEAIGGHVTFQQGWPVVDGDPEVVAPGGEYPNATIDVDFSSAATSKWALASEIADEAIARMLLQPVDTAFGALAHEIAKRTDTAAMAAITAATSGNVFDVTGAGNGGAWTSAANIVASVLKAKATAETADQGVVFDSIVLRPSAYAATVALLVSAGLFPREAQNPLTTTAAPSFAGLTWRSSVRAGADPLLVDSTRLGGIAVEKIGGPYAQYGANGIEVLADRINNRDSYRIQARKVSVPFIIDPSAALWLDGTGI